MSQSPHYAQGEPIPTAIDVVLSEVQLQTSQKKISKHAREHAAIIACDL